ncbi:Multidrug resistance protein MdtF [Aminobacter aminovorans]|uniref:Multidrug resistance protein MdtF n=1 Tax=Aminobacter aminovorans TaxID=83263 RepID=A0A381IK06_AMIAI|nr:Multidrug resistance protein MdtF [Aminobacter aminovorans]
MRPAAIRLENSATGSLPAGTFAEIETASAAMQEATEGEILLMKPSAIDELGTTSSFAMRLIDRDGNGAEALQKASDKLIKLTAYSKLLQNVRVDGLPSGPSGRLHIDRAKAEALGVNLSTITVVAVKLERAYRPFGRDHFRQGGHAALIVANVKLEYAFHLHAVLGLGLRDLGRCADVSRAKRLPRSGLPCSVRACRSRTHAQHWADGFVDRHHGISRCEQGRRGGLA